MASLLEKVWPPKTTASARCPVLTWLYSMVSASMADRIGLLIEYMHQVMPMNTKVNVVFEYPTK
ncbi:Uncharacterised protein [Bifidobacterium longum subsp. infantis]|uniref:Uncharacterized protein n=1 Tax=Bifidobacterium longum subsp. infantis TaxID=1682 RepID=A0A564RZG7_BIFLI|nr:Uncharacterised protein [Bifidobacterium longum subsp. infantis]